ncbi:DUF5691 domain-containing protein [Actinoplanes subglobosus]|uniref:DUF5691 domain-containing protein n=1 Tax=Actinoplanes subglobosus TaxID=1547892 RepID=A0ABV8ISC4_9ACTN
MPVERWSAAQVEALTPDPASLRDARGVAGPFSAGGPAGDRSKRTVPPDPAAAAKRARGRSDRVAGGMAELQRWLDDQIEQGLAVAGRAGPQPFEMMAARLVDAQAPGAAGMVRRLGGFAGAGPQWADRLLGELALLRLLVTGHARLGDLDPALAATVRARIGFPTATEEVLAGPRVTDRWQVLGQVETDEGALTSRRTWLRGSGGRFALVLSFAAPGQPLPADLIPGTEFRADLCFYPGSAPLRALVAERVSAAEPFASPDGAGTIRAGLAGWASLVAAEPWRHDAPMLVSSARPTSDGHLVDAEGWALPLAPGHREPWWLLAAAGGSPATVAAEWSPAGLRPLAAWVDGRFVPTAPPVPDSSSRRPAELPPELLTAALVGTGRRPWAGRSVRVDPLTVDLGSPAGAPPSAVADGSPASAPPSAVADGSPAGAPPSAVADGSPAGAPPSAVAGGSLAGAPVSAEAGRSPGAPSSAGRLPDATGSPESLSAGPAAALLEAAAVALTCRRAGVEPEIGRVPVDAAPPETDVPLPPAAAARLARILDGGAPGGGHHEQALLIQWLAAAVGRGGIVPPVILPDLLEAGRRNALLRADVAGVAGRRGAWLAAQRADWHWLLTEAAPTRTGDWTATAARTRDWTTSATAERLGLLVELRRSDPGRARELLESTWGEESSDNRARFLATLGTGLSLDDEPLLERALDDRRKEVREAALDLLRQLPGAALGRRMTARARAAVRLDGSGRLTVEPPTELDRDLRRDGVSATPVRGIGVGAWLLEEVLAGTPLSTWTVPPPSTGAGPLSTAGLGPSGWIAAARGHDWANPLVHGWAKAAVVQRDPRWATALLAADHGTLREAVRWDLHLVLPPDELARLATAALRSEDGSAQRLLGLHPGPWPDGLSVAVLETVDQRARNDRHTWQLGELCRAAALAMPPGYADLAGRLAAQLDRVVDPARVRPVAELARTLIFRHEMLQELQ